MQEKKTHFERTAFKDNVIEVYMQIKHNKINRTVFWIISFYCSDTTHYKKPNSPPTTPKNVQEQKKSAIMKLKNPKTAIENELN